MPLQPGVFKFTNSIAQVAFLRQIHFREPVWKRGSVR